MKRFWIPIWACLASWCLAAGEASALSIHKPAHDHVIRLTNDRPYLLVAGSAGHLAPQSPVVVDIHDRRRSGFFEAKTWEGSGAARVVLADGSLVFKPQWKERLDRIAIKSKIPAMDITKARFSIDIWLPSAYVTDQNLVIEPFVTDGHGYYAALTYVPAARLTGETWNTIHVASVERSSMNYVHPNCDLENIEFIGVNFQAKGKEATVMGDIKIDNFFITGASHAAKLDFYTLTSFTTTIDNDHTWSLQVPAADVRKLPREIIITANTGDRFDKNLQPAVAVTNAEAQAAGKSPRPRRWRGR